MKRKHDSYALLEEVRRLREEKKEKSNHVLMTTKDCDCGGDTGYCPICDGGLGVCKICGRGESELLLDGGKCPGSRR